MCLGITEASLSRRPAFPVAGKGEERRQLRIRQPGIQGLNTNQERLLYPSSEDCNTTGGNEYDGSESLLRCYIRVEIFLSR